MTSTNGVTWTPQVAASDDSWSSVTYGSGTFVAVASSGDDSRVMTSPNGVTWTLRKSPAAHAWQSVTWGVENWWPDTFVAVGSNPPRSSQVMRSALTWSPDALGCIAAWNGGAWSPVSSGLNGKAQVMTVLGDDTLVVGGGFDRAGTLGPPNSLGLQGLAAWSDGTWTAPGVGGFSTSVEAMVAGADDALYVGGGYQGPGLDDSGISVARGPCDDSPSWFSMSTGFSHGYATGPGGPGERDDDRLREGGNGDGAHPDLAGRTLRAGCDSAGQHGRDIRLVAQRGQAQDPVGVLHRRGRDLEHPARGPLGLRRPGRARSAAPAHWPVRAMRSRDSSPRDRCVISVILEPLTVAESSLGRDPAGTRMRR